MSQSSVDVHATRRGLGLIAFAATLWGTVGVASQGVYRVSATTPLSIGFFRLVIAAPLLLIACFFLLGRRSWQITRRDAGVMAIIGAMLALYQVCFFTAIVNTGVTIATLVTLCTAPIMAAVLSAIFTRERLNRTIVMSLTGALLGTLLLVGIPESGAAGDHLITGVLFALGSAFGYAIVAICGRLVSKKAHPLQTNAIAFGTGALLLLVLTLPTGGPLLSYPTEGWLLLIYLGAVPSALGYVLFFRGMQVTSATVATLITLVEPLTATLLAWWLFKEQLGPFGFVGAGLLIGSLLLLARRGAR
jgi:DME family drug/metabolite transporter